MRVSNRDRPLRILHLVPADGIGGVESAAKSMFDSYDVSCDFRLLFIEQQSPSKRAKPDIFTMFGANVNAFRQAKAFGPDVIVCSLWRSVPLALVLRATHRKSKLALFIHNDIAMHPLDTLFTKVAIRAADVVWGDSEATIAARGVPRDRARVISFVTDRLVAPEWHNPSPRFVSWGRLSHQKGIDRSIRLIAILAARGLDVRYDAYGPDGGALDGLMTLARDLGVENRVRFPGAVLRNELTEIAAQYRFFLQLSRSEGMCMAVVEAMQLGLVPIATKAGEMANYVSCGKTGISVNPDRLEVAADAVQRLIRDEISWRHHSDNAARYWLRAPLYGQDVCDAAHILVGSVSDEI